MRTPLILGGLGAAFLAGIFCQPLIGRADAQSGPAPLTAQIINLSALSEDEIGPLAPNADLRSRTLVTTPEGTIAVQSGNVLKHFHAEANEIQLILDGSGSFWLGDREVQVKPGDLIVIPKGTPHAGSRATTGRFRSLAIKLPPQRQGDVHPVP
ncbi:cupin [Pseudoroseomonas deserti]|uniref:Cupin n=1 Tax=Teichococcus deserti TaxID=1817963 RepID=A0A1V2H022_9PROT|nr:cupin domain-containing protein [Pseudoroseomonas deserti]ONG51577.1 cupin [Pseudoroseomonas deserti]